MRRVKAVTVTYEDGDAEHYTGPGTFDEVHTESNGDNPVPVTYITVCLTPIQPIVHRKAPRKVAASKGTEYVGL